MQTALLVLHVIIAVAMIALILIQHGKGADAGAAFGSGASATVFGARGSASFLTRATAVLAFLFFSNSLALAYLSGHATKQESVVSQQPTGETAPVKVPEDSEVVKTEAQEPGAGLPKASSDMPVVPEPIPGLPGTEDVGSKKGTVTPSGSSASEAAKTPGAPAATGAEAPATTQGSAPAPAPTPELPKVDTPSAPTGMEPPASAKPDVKAKEEVKAEELKKTPAKSPEGQPKGQTAPVEVISPKPEKKKVAPAKSEQKKGTNAGAPQTNDMPPEPSSVIKPLEKADEAKPGEPPSTPASPANKAPETSESDFPK